MPVEHRLLIVSILKHPDIQLPRIFHRLFQTIIKSPSLNSHSLYFRYWISNKRVLIDDTTKMANTRIQLRPTPYQISLLLSFVLPAVLLNPVLFLHGLNAILSRVLPPIAVPNTSTQPPPYHPLGPSAENPHIDIHASDSLCWSYTGLILVAQLVAFQVFKMPSQDENKNNDDQSTEQDATSEENKEQDSQPTSSFDKLKPKSQPPPRLSLIFSALLWALNLSYNAYRKHARDHVGHSLGNDTRMLVGLDQAQVEG